MSAELLSAPLTPLQRANQLVYAAEVLARRARVYLATGEKTQPGRWLFWYRRALRAIEASSRLHQRSRACLGRALAERRPC